MRRGRTVLGILLLLSVVARTAAAQGKAAAPVFDPPPGTYPAPLTVRMTSATPGATMRYTTDGSRPFYASPIYPGPLGLSTKTTLKAVAFKTGLAASAVTLGEYQVTAPPVDENGPLYLATLTPQPGAESKGSGSASLHLATDSRSATLRFSSTGLSGPLTASHVHGPGGLILFDLDTTEPQADGSRVWRIQAAGTLSEAAILTALRGGECYLNLHTAASPAGEIQGYFRVASGSQAFVPPPAPPPLPPGPPGEEDAARFLLQATYGPRLEDIDAVRQRGFAAWLDEQLALPTASHLASYDQLVGTGEEPTPGLVRESFFQQAIGGPDQLRQRLAFALSEFFVVSDRDADVRNAPDGLAAYLDLLTRHAFGSFRELLEAVTLSPTMGVYLDMAGSTKAIPEQGRLPNENYAREILQLFSIGLYQLHPDGTLRLDAANQPIPTYEQEVVEAFAQAFTGWTLGGQFPRRPQRFFRPQRNFRIPMEPWAQYHATNEKRLLDGALLPAGQSAQQDLEAALDTIARHPNVGPFVCRFLIQRLVTSNPSPAYVYRCGQAFADNGAGARGDLAAVVRAILLDYEARSATLPGRQDYGHLREPVVRLAGLLRTLRATPRNGRWRLAQFERQSGFSSGQIPLRAPTVFNFFEPGYALPGEIAQAGLLSPEFQIATETTVVGGANLHLAVLGAGGAGGQLALDLAAFLRPQVANDEALLDRVDLLFFARAMSEETRDALRDALADADFPRPREQRVLTLLWLASLAPESVVQK